MRFHRIIAAAWLAVMYAVGPACADKRVALVVGNGAYRHADRLANPVNDARGMRDALKGLGFDVAYGEDLDLKGLQDVVGQFAERVEDADVALVYFAGHGATFGDTPYVAPVDAEFSSLRRVPYELMAVETLIGELRHAKGVRIAILDACRDNAAERDLKKQAAATRGGDVMRGLAPMKNPSGMIVAYATQYLSTAADDAGASGGGRYSGGGSAPRHSPFTAALLNNIATPGLDVKDMFFKVGSDVTAATGGRQRPEISISMYEQYVLAAAKSGEDSSGGASGLPAAGADEIAWSFLKDAGTADQLRRFIAQYPASPHVRDAEARLRAITEQAAVVAPLPKPAVPAADLCSGPVTASFPSRCAAPLTASQERGLKLKDSFKECTDCPEMVVVPAGSFTMGSPANKMNQYSGESPQHVVTIGRPFAVGKTNVTRDQFARFVKETGHAASRSCYKSSTTETSDGSWRDPGFAQDGSHPVVCISWQDAKAYADWVGKKTGEPYRMLSEAEFEYAARGRTSADAYPRFWFGDDERELCRNANGADQKAKASIQNAKEWLVAACNDGYAYTSPVGHYAANVFGLFDMAGNAYSWTADCYHNSYEGAPSDGSAWITTCSGRARMARGGSWDGLPVFLYAAARSWYTEPYDSVGFRLARTLTR